MSHIDLVRFVLLLLPFLFIPLCICLLLQQPFFASFSFYFAWVETSSFLYLKSIVKCFNRKSLTIYWF